jgi:hypothetical protein
MYTASMISGVLDPFASAGLQSGLVGYVAGYMAGGVLLLSAAALISSLCRRRHRLHALRFERPGHMAERRPWRAHTHGGSMWLCRKVKP